MNQNNLSKIISSFIEVNPVYEFNSLSKSNTNSSNVHEEQSSSARLKELKELKELNSSNVHEEQSSSARLKELKELNSFNVPILELYQYEIKNHPNESVIVNPKEYESFTDSDNEDNCSIYSYSDEEKPETKISSCDIIVNGPKIKFNDNISYFYQYLQNLYKIAKLKNEKVLDDKETMSKILLPYNSILELIAEYERIFDPLIKFKKSEEEKISVKEFNSNNYVNHIKKINTNNNEKFICIGDVHGSIHTFIRLLFRFHKYGILDIKTMKIIEPYNIIFLGDIIDRGSWGLEIACTLIILLINNPQRMHWNSGNHEDKELNLLYGFYSEINKKYSHFIDNREKITYLHDSLNKFFGYLSCAIIIHNVDINKKYWLAHGGIPQKLNTNSMNPEEPDIPFNSSFYSFDSKIKIWKISPENDSSGYYLVNDETAHSIKWSDFPYEGYCKRSSNLKCNTFEYFSNFMTKYSINGIIRGHQDSISNSLVFKNENDKVLFNQTDRTEKLNNIYWNNRGNNNRYFGPLARLHIDRAANQSDLIHPVITISTNTDKGRKLTADSFGLLRFDINPDDSGDFSKYILKSRNMINDLNNFKQKYLKYKLKYFQLKNSIKL